MYCDGSTLVHTVSYLEFYLFHKQKPIKIVRKKRTHLTVCVVEITMKKVIQTYCDVISEMLVARMSVISRGLQHRPPMPVPVDGHGLIHFRLRVRGFFLKCRISNPSSLIDVSVPHSLTTKQKNCCAYCYLFTLTFRNEWGYQKGPCLFLFRFQICERKTNNKFLFRFQICERKTNSFFIFRFHK